MHCQPGVLRGDLLLLTECKLSQNPFATKLLCLVQDSAMGNQLLVEKSVDLRHKTVYPLHPRQGENRKAACFSPRPTCATSLDGLQFASPPAPPYVSRKRGNKEIPCYALQCFPEKRPHPCTWDEAESSHSTAFTTQHQQVHRLKPV